jgi:hypothetical protein
MQTLQTDYFTGYHNLKLTRDANGVLIAEFHSNGGPLIMSAQAHTEFVDAFYRIGQDRANKIVILTGAGGEFITDVDWSSFGDVADPGVWSQVHDEGVQVFDSAGIGELIQSFTTIRNQGGQMKLVNLNKRVQDLLVMTNLHKVFEIHDDEASAIKAFGGQVASGAVS